MTNDTLEEFSKENQLVGSVDARFEHLTGFLCLRRHYSRGFATDDIVVGDGGSDSSVDTIAILINGALVTDVDQIEEMLEQNGDLDVKFVFVQASTSASFDGAKIGNIAFGVKDFFEDKPKLVRNQDVTDVAEIAAAIYQKSTKFKRNPSCYVYYVSTASRHDDAELNARRSAAEADIASTGFFGEVKFLLFGSSDIQRLYRQTKNAISREFVFREKTEIPKIEGVHAAWLGYLPAADLVGVIGDEAGDNVLGSIFDDNVRDWQGYNKVNDQIKATLESDDKRARFILMNNGVTIITRILKQNASKFYIEDFQVVNGCQTSNVIFDQREMLQKNPTVAVPLRLIWTEDDNVIESVVYGTNSQTQLNPEQLQASRTFSKKLEQYFSTFKEEGQQIYYERRDGQYDRAGVPKNQVMPPKVVIRAYAAMFLNEPHTATKNYANLRDRIGGDIFGEGHVPGPYYVAAYAAFKLEQQYGGKIDRKYKSARHHILLALRLLMDSAKTDWPNSKKMTARSEAMMQLLWDPTKVDNLFQQAKAVIDQVTKGDLSRDKVRTITTTDSIVECIDQQKVKK